jgi:hypothetical protein
VAAETVRLDDEETQKAFIFRDGKLEAILGTAARILIRRGQIVSASILANADLSVRHLNYDNWNGGQDYWRIFMGIPVSTYFDLENREELQTQIEEAIRTPLEVTSDCDFITCEITTELERDPDWRQKTRQHLSGEGINNQGRVHSQNIAAREYDNLRFRSRPEIYFYRALKDAGLAFAPLSVILGRDGLGQRTRRIEPDFVIFKDGIVTIVEIDGDLYHTETPHEAHSRLKFLTDEGARLERIDATACNTDDKAREAVGRVILGIEKKRRARG